MDGLDCHTIEFYYYMRILGDDLSLCKNISDAGVDLVWLPIEKSFMLLKKEIGELEFVELFW